MRESEPKVNAKWPKNHRDSLWVLEFNYIKLPFITTPGGLRPLKEMKYSSDFETIQCFLEVGNTQCTVHWVAKTRRTLPNNQNKIKIRLFIKCEHR